MLIIYNNKHTELPNDFMTLEDLVEWKQIRPQGTAIAVNNNIVTKDQWGAYRLKEMDRITVISAAFGG